MNMMHVISIPYALMKVNPLSWIQKVFQYKGNIATTPEPLNVITTLLTFYYLKHFVVFNLLSFAMFDLLYPVS